MQKIYALILALVLVATLATSTQASAAEQPSLRLFGNYTIQDNGQVFYELRMDGDKVCYLGFTIQTDLRVLEIQTAGSVFHEVMYEGDKVIAYSLGNVNADHVLVIKVVLEAPNPAQSYTFNLVEVQAYNFAEQQLKVTTDCPVIEVRQEAPPATEPAPTEPAPTEPTTTDPKPTNPEPSDSDANTQSSTKPQAGISSNQKDPASPGENSIGNLEECGDCQKTVSVKHILTTISNVCFAIVAILVIVILVILIGFALAWKKNDNDQQ